MKINNKRVNPIACMISLGALILSSSVTLACTRLVYLGDDNETITARSMDWKKDVGTNLWVFPRELHRSGEGGQHTLKWVSKYGSVIAAAYDISTTDGINEKGLAANLLWLVESEYPTAAPTAEKPGLSVAAWAQYVLDNFATVDEAVQSLKQDKFTLVTANVPGEERLAKLHLSLSDSSGDSAIIEYINGKPVIHHKREYQVMTNSPVFDQQLALNTYWEQIGGNVMLPGTNRAADRFVRASFYVNHIPKNEGHDKALASAFSVIRNVSVPYGYALSAEPNIASTRWRSVIDHKSMQYFFESAMSPNIFWVDLKKVDFSPRDGSAMKLDLGPNQSKIYSGQVSDQFKKATPFDFAGI
ncbi:linear amide C-N hydrolase [Dickeya dadantii]|uniref:linear amide C-N hydrolase n=1 Tax=Dickeya dadantii TaxID=204038 RepID=UPI0013729DB5|nr:linear amide C-N hydrolase [Dickeya dadantii]NAT79668.1 choloylglycine hydrolase [Dickeya dadantii]NPE63830.1 linear amide C-N hydrolase [Dickeya dadantii]